MRFDMIMTLISSKKTGWLPKRFSGEKTTPEGFFCDFCFKT